MIKCINSFSNIKLIPNSLVVLDIDETILSFPTLGLDWWHKTYQRNLKMTNNHTRAENISLTEWLEVISDVDPKQLDPYNFEKFLDEVKKLNCELILLTARNNSLMEITKNHLKSCNINVESIDIYYDSNKGKKLLELVDYKYKKIKNIIFVDDLEHNILDVQKAFQFNPYHNLYLYHIFHF